MKTARTILLAFLCSQCFCLRLAAEDAEGPPGRKCPADKVIIGGHDVLDIFVMLGAKREKGVADEELADYSRIFDRIDADHDGKHSKTEYIENGGYMSPMARRGIFNAADSNADGFVTRVEYVLNRIITDEAKSIIQPSDANKDGTIAKDEFIAGMILKDRALAAALFDALDTDGDGAITVPECLRVWGDWARPNYVAQEAYVAKRLEAVLGRAREAERYNRDAIRDDSRLHAACLPPELPLWEKPPAGAPMHANVQEQVRFLKPRPGSPSGLNRVFSLVSVPTYSIHRPKNPNGVGLVICPGGGFRDVWIDHEGHDLAIWLKDHGVTSLVLKYRTRLDNGTITADEFQNYLRAVRLDGWQAVRVLRKQAKDLGLQPDKIGICGFSAGGHLAASCALYLEPKPPEDEVSGMPDFAALFYPRIPDDISQAIESRTTSGAGKSGICPFFIINAQDDEITPVDKRLSFYAMLLKAGVHAELHVFSSGSHGFGLGEGRGKTTALWPNSFAAWLEERMR